MKTKLNSINPIIPVIVILLLAGCGGGGPGGSVTGSGGSPLPGTGTGAGTGTGTGTGTGSGPGPGANINSGVDSLIQTAIQDDNFEPNNAERACVNALQNATTAQIRNCIDNN